MIIISSGFPKSASTLLFFYTEELLKRSGKKTGQEKFRKQNPEGFISHFGIFITLKLLFLSVFYGDVVVKSHTGPTFFVRLLINLGFAKAYYSIRDPRDVVLSALDHAKKARTKTIKSPSDIAFAPFQSRADLYPALHMHFNRFSEWKHYGKVLFLRYEDLLGKPEEELSSVLNWLNRKNALRYIPAVVSDFNAKKMETKNFNKGEISRFQNEMSQEIILEIETKLREYFPAMNYPFSNNTKA
jgi:hypothetical protein